MAYFSEDDINKAVENLDSVPDGLIDNSDYVNTFIAVYEAMKNLEPESEDSRLLFMMRVINMMGDDSEISSRVLEVVTCLSFHIVNFMEIGTILRDDFVEKYISNLSDEIIPRLEAEKGVMPYWNE